MIPPSFARRQGGCNHPSTRYYRRPYLVGRQTREHIVELCIACGRNARGPGRWVPRRAVRHPELLPELPAAAEAQPLPDLYGEEARAR
jgi:hypothetical protein